MLRISGPILHPDPAQPKRKFLGLRHQSHPHSAPARDNRLCSSAFSSAWPFCHFPSLRHSPSAPYCSSRGQVCKLKRSLDRNRHQQLLSRNHCLAHELGTTFLYGLDNAPLGFRPTSAASERRKIASP